MPIRGELARWRILPWWDKKEHHWQIHTTQALLTDSEAYRWSPPIREGVDLVRWSDTEGNPRGLVVKNGVLLIETYGWHAFVELKIIPPANAG
jgi:hypothetical protein